MTELWRSSASELVARIRSREVSAKEAAVSALQRLEAVNPALNAIVSYRPESVIEQADAVDRASSRGDDPGPLAALGLPGLTVTTGFVRGVPVGVQLVAAHARKAMLRVPIRRWTMARHQQPDRPPCPSSAHCSSTP